MRTRTLLGLAITLTVVPVAAARVAAGGPVSSVPTAFDGSRPVTGETRALAVLRAWDRRRADAWSAGDADELARLYAAGSRTGRRDVNDLRRWRTRGLRVVGLRQQMSALGIRVETSRRLVLTVTDRTLAGLAVGHHRRTALPGSAWTTHRIRLVRRHREWLVAEVVAQPAR